MRGLPAPGELAALQERAALEPGDAVTEIPEEAFKAAELAYAQRWPSHSDGIRAAVEAAAPAIRRECDWIEVNPENPAFKRLQKLQAEAP